MHRVRTARKQRIQLYKHPILRSYSREKAKRRMSYSEVIQTFLNYLNQSWVRKPCPVTGAGRKQQRKSPSMENVWKAVESTPSGVCSDTRYRMNAGFVDNPQQSFPVSTKRTDEAEAKLIIFWDSGPEVSLTSTEFQCHVKIHPLRHLLGVV